MKDYLFVGKNLPNPLEKEKTEELFLRMADGNKDAKDKIIMHNIKLVLSIVNREFSNTRCDKQDLVAIGIIGLIKAVNTYNLDKKVQFTTYASKCILNEILLSFRQTKKHINDISLDTTISKDYDGNEQNLIDILFDENSDIILNYERKEVYKIINQIIEELEPRDKFITVNYFGFNNSEPLSQEKIANMMGISRSYVSYLIIKILGDIKAQLLALEIIEKNELSIHK